MTSSVGYLCGPIALETSLQAVRAQYYGGSSEGVYGIPITQQRLRQLLFTNWDTPAGPNDMGDPTPEYEAYIQQRLSEISQDDDDMEVRAEEYENMTRLNNMDFQQLIAMLVLARQQGLVEAEFSLAIVYGTHTDDQDRAVPAFTRIVHEINENAPTLFLHHNLAASEDDYSHWEGFGAEPTAEDYDIALGW